MNVNISNEFNFSVVHVVARSHSAILHIYVPYPFVAIPVGFSMVKRSVDNCNFFKINQEEYTSPMHY